MINVLFSVGRVLDFTVITSANLVNEVSGFVVVGRGGSAPYVWSAVALTGAGTLQESVDGASYSVSFLPTVSGTYTFSVSVTDARRVLKTKLVSVRVLDPFAELVLGTEDGDAIGVDLGDDVADEDVLLGVDGALVPPTP